MTFEATCPDCNGPLEKRTFIDTPDDISENWWCPTCRRRWLAWDFEPDVPFGGEPVEASG